MTNPMKIKGTAFEKQATEILNSLIRKALFKRVPGSGALGTILKEAGLNSDIKGTIESIPQEFRIEAKVGYNNSKVDGVKQFTLKKEWLDKVKMEADACFGIPMLVGKFLGAREGTKVFVVMDIEVFANLMNRLTDLYEDNEKLNVETGDF